MRSIAKKTVITLVVLFLIAAGVAFIVLKVWERGSETESQVDSGEELVTRQEVEPGKLPAKFPAEIPVEEDAEVTENFNAENTSVTEAVRSFKSKKTLEANFALYESFLKKDNWAVKHVVNNPSSKIIFAEKAEGDLQIGLYKSADNETVLVNLLYTVINR